MPLNFPGLFPPGKEINITFDWTDLASATGYVSYDCYSTKDNTGITYLLIESANKGSLTSITSYDEQTPRGHYALSQGEINQTSSTKEVDVDFDTTAFQLPRTIRGTAYISFYSHIHKTAGDSPLWYMLVRIRKWNGTSETEIANNRTEEFSYKSNQDLLHNLTITIPKTLIKKGEQLRITIEGWGKAASGTSWITISGDPANLAQTDQTRSMAATKTRIITQIPYEINI